MRAAPAGTITRMTADVPTRSWLGGIPPILTLAMCVAAAVFSVMGTIQKFQTTKALGVLALALLFCVLLAWGRSPPRRWHAVADRRSPTQILALLMLFGFVLRLIWVLVARTEPVSDFSRYHALARNLVLDGYLGVNGEPSAFRPPGWPVVLSLVYRIGVDPIIGGGVLNALCSTATIPAVYHLARGGLGRAVALLAALLWTVFPSQIFGSSVAATEPLFTLLFTWIAVVGLRILEAGESDRPVRIVTSSLQLGLLVAMATYVRGHALLVPGALLGLSAVFGPRRFRVFAVFAVATLLTIAALIPWGLRNQRELGDFQLLTTNSGSTLYQANNSKATGSFLASSSWPDSFRGLSEIESNRRAKELGVRWIREHPAEFLELIPRKLLYLFDSDVDLFSFAASRLESGTLQSVFRALCQAFYVGVMLLAVLGALWIRRCTGPLPLLICALLLLWFLIHAVFHGQPRFHVPVLPLFCVLAAAAAGPPDEAGSGRRTGTSDDVVGSGTG